MVCLQQDDDQRSIAPAADVSMLEPSFYLKIYATAQVPVLCSVLRRTSTIPNHILYAKLIINATVGR